MFILRRQRIDINVIGGNSRRPADAGTEASLLGGPLQRCFRGLLAPGYSRPSAFRFPRTALAPQPSTLNPQPSRGITLIELLVVIAIMTMVAAIAIPRMRPMMENRNVRESARGINVFLSQARVRAMETGLPCGVLFERATDLNQPNACTVMRQVEIPPPYGGDTVDTRIIVSLNTIDANGNVVLQAQLSSGAATADLIHVGDLLKIDYQGPLYTISAVSATASGFPLTLTTNVGPGGAVPWTVAASNAVPFLIYRQPLDQSSGVLSAFGSIAPSLQLPRGAAVDLRYSGKNSFAADPLDPTNPILADSFRAETTSDSTPVIVMFSPSGALDRVCYQSTQERVTAPVFLLVGRADRVDTALLPDDNLNNWQDMNNFWLAISPQTGMVTAAEPAAVASGATNPVDASRALAREAQFSKGGR
jgi:prepilin-type N-terminal cleavage/methylation domain-containing protein